MGVNRDSMHKRRATGGKKKAWRKKRKHELGRQPANTKLSNHPKKIVRRIRVRGGNVKWRALRLNSGNFSWASESVTKITRLLSVTYNAASDELLKKQTLVKGAIVLVDAAPFKLWYHQHYGVEFAARKFSVAEKGTYTAEAAIKKMNIKEPACREPPTAKELQKIIQEQFDARQWLARITSRPGQCGRADGYILEGKELLFYMKKMNYKKLPGRSCYDFMNIKIMFE